MANAIILESKQEMTIPTANGDKVVYALGMQLYSAASNGHPVNAKFLQTDECVEAFVGVYPFGGLVFSTAVTATTDDLVITAIPVGGSSSDATSASLTVAQLLALDIGDEVKTPAVSPG